MTTYRLDAGAPQRDGPVDVARDGVDELLGGESFGPAEVSSALTRHLNAAGSRRVVRLYRRGRRRWARTPTSPTDCIAARLGAVVATAAPISCRDHQRVHRLAQLAGELGNRWAVVGELGRVVHRAEESLNQTEPERMRGDEKPGRTLKGGHGRRVRVPHESDGRDGRE